MAMFNEDPFHRETCRLGIVRSHGAWSLSVGM